MKKITKSERITRQKLANPHMDKSYKNIMANYKPLKNPKMIDLGNGYMQIVSED